MGGGIFGRLLIGACDPMTWSIHGCRYSILEATHLTAPPGLLGAVAVAGTSAGAGDAGAVAAEAEAAPSALAEAAAAPPADRLEQENTPAPHLV